MARAPPERLGSADLALHFALLSTTCKTREWDILNLRFFFLSSLFLL